jgi:hypothetical protein
VSTRNSITTGRVIKFFQEKKFTWKMWKCLWTYHRKFVHQNYSKFKCFLNIKSHIQWRQLNVITDNVISRFMWSIWQRALFKAR